MLSAVIVRCACSSSAQREDRNVDSFRRRRRRQRRRSDRPHLHRRRVPIRHHRGSQEYRNRAAQTLSLFLTVCVTSALITVPQPRAALGVEFLLAAAGSATLLAVLDTAARGDREKKTNLALTLALVVFAACIAASGILLLLGQGQGLYFFVVSALLGLVWGVYGAWVFLTQAGINSVGDQP